MAEQPDMSAFNGDAPSAIQVAFVAVHEMYTSLRGAGFTEYQALVIIANMMRPVPDVDVEPS